MFYSTGRMWGITTFRRKLRMSLVEENFMKTQIFSSCTMCLVLGFAATQRPAAAQATPGLEGVWFAEVTPINCVTRLPIPNVTPIHSLHMFGHDGSFTNESASLGPTPIRSSGVGRWDRTQGQMFTAAFQFFNYN